MIQIVGGAYYERCVDPHWSHLFGSGGRAAAALAHIDGSVTLTTYLGKEQELHLELVASSFDFSLDKIESTLETVSFFYQHSLSNPIITPSSLSTKSYAPLFVEAENAIRYGFIEGGAIVHGERVVYDPQNDYNSESFRINGSTAGKLAVVANINECQKITDSPHDLRDPTILGKKLLEVESAEVVVVKQGSLGSTVVTSSENHFIPASITPRMFSIGSGDIFTAIFSHFWISENKNPLEAATLASSAVALYCDKRTLPIPKNFFEISHYPLLNPKKEEFETTKQIYLAGPFFNIAERWLIEETLVCFAREGIKVFSPLHAVGRGKAKDIAPADLAGLHYSDIVFAILNGQDPGTIFEIGYARSINKPVVIFAQNVSKSDLTMFEGTDCVIVDDFASAVYRTVWAALQL